MAERATFGQWSFNGGELSPKLQARTDQAVYSIALAEMVGYLPLLQGPAQAAPGTLFVEEAAGPCRLFPFEYNPTQGYAVEASANLFRFFTNNVRLESGGLPVEVAHDYSYAELLELDYQQSADVLYYAGAGKAPKKLLRLGAASFDLEDLELRNGPIDIGNNDEDVTVGVSGTTGTITVTASAAIFDEGDVGGLFEIEAKDFSDVKSWEPGMEVDEGDQRTWAGRVYEAVSRTTGGGGWIDFRTGGVPPEHDEGEEWDGNGGSDVNGHGPYGVKWLYLYSRYGLVRITDFTSGTVVEATVIKRLADSLVTVPTWKWAFGAFSNRRGWPDTIGLWNDCLVLTKGNKGFTSVIGDYENFERRDSAGDFQRDLAGQFSLPGPHRIQWQAADRQLLLGTQTAEYTVERMQIQTGTPGPPVFEIRLQSSNGSAKVKPIQADGRMLFLQRAGRKLREMGYAITADRYQAPDMTRLADHIGAAGFTELAWQAEPERLAWAVRGDGSLAAMTYDPDQTVMGWCRRPMATGLEARSACRITDPAGEFDQLWIAAEFGGNHWILRMERPFATGDDQADQYFVDAGLTYSGAPTSSGAGADHLVGLTVQVLADGKVHPSIVIGAGGTWQLEYEASKIHLGLEFPAYFTTLSPEAGQSEGTAQTKIKRVLAANLRVVDTQGIRIRAQDCDFVPVELRTAEVPMDEAVPLYTGTVTVPLVGTYDRMGQITVERYQPVNSCIVALVPVIEVGQR